jgi:hypothetical protein
MDEYVRRIYQKDRRKKNSWRSTSGRSRPPVELLKPDWPPNYSCNDYVRNDVARRLRAGTLMS